MSRDRHLNVHRFSHSTGQRRQHRDSDEADIAGTDPSQFDLDVFDQGDRWVDSAGIVYPIELMDAGERRNLASWLRRNATYFYVRVLARDLAFTLRQTPGELPPIASQTPLRWLTGTRLMQALELSSDDEMMLE